MKVNNSIVFGRTYKDVITGFTGIAIGFANYITGCDSIMLVPESDDEGTKRRDGEWFDIDRLQHMKLVDDISLNVSTGADDDDDDSFAPVDTELPRPTRVHTGSDAMPPQQMRRD